MNESGKLERFSDWKTLNDLYKLLLERGSKLPEENTQEIERKWIFTPPEELNQKFAGGFREQILRKLGKIERQFDAYQWYLSTDPEIRFRAVLSDGDEVPHWYLAYKSSAPGLSRVEYEFEIDTFSAAILSDYISSHMIVEPLACAIVKEYYALRIENTLYEISFVDDGALSYFEVEFSSEEEANNFELSDVIRDYLHPIEVTGQDEYRMAKYWERDRSKYIIKREEISIPDINKKTVSTISDPIPIDTLKGLVDYHHKMHPGCDVVVEIRNGVPDIRPV